ncbi:hypothetical protein K457DRAFT_23960 [Linnemannia elongata AG-77]|uniref:Uncharacterized protein n=1 Tax=Linnemannia elongata AG-77 TaxID=1314771 RepID=A0A197JJT6_9FUNG|nr:hypothetical protein K457DRAFT_23960 [Linnemannia elongata AG-77]
MYRASSALRAPFSSSDVSSKEIEFGLTALTNLQTEILRLQTQKTFASTAASQRLSELLGGVATCKGQASPIFSDHDLLSDRKYKSLSQNISRLDRLIAEVESPLKDLNLCSLRVLLFKKPHVPFMIPDPERLQWHKRCLRNNGPLRSYPHTRYHNHQALQSPGIEDRSPKHTLDNSCSRVGKSEHGKTYPYELESNPFKFLAQVHSHCKNAWGPMFLKCSICLLNKTIKDAAAQCAFTTALEMMDDDFVPANWDICQKMFINRILTPRERQDAVASIVKTGMNKLELFREYGARLGGIVSAYSIDDGDSTVLPGLLTSLPSALNNIKLGIRLRRNDHCPVHFDSIETILSALRDLEGPDQARKRDAFAVSSNSDPKAASFTQSSTTARSRGDKRTRTIKMHTISPTTRNFKFNCKKCGNNNSHPTGKCLVHKTCNKCNRTGHLAADYRGGLSVSAWRRQQDDKVALHPHQT